MSAYGFLRDIAYDIVKAGPRFALASMRVSMSVKAEQRVTLKGVGPILVRPKNSDYSTFRQVYRDEDYRIGIKQVEDRIQSAYETIIGAGQTPVIIDAGANVGAATLWFAHRFPRAVTVAIEPDSENARILRRNIQDVPQVKLMEAAVGGTPGFVAVQGSSEAWAVRTVRVESGLPIVTVADAVASVPNGRLFIAKIDIEGFESDLFAGDTNWLEDVIVIYIEPHDWMMPGERTSRSFQSAIAKHDFEIFLQGENLAYVR